ncbi:MAG: acyl-CoA thioesterase [Planctomycetaceae bacterium]|nr:acyl-CoA thioesterase [Planctomycetaceae bacterium]
MTPSTTEKSLGVRVPLRVKPYDIDVLGIVSNIVYVRWMEDLRLAMLDAYLPLDQQMSEGYVPAILKVEIDYKRAIELHDELVGVMWLSGLKKLRYEVTAEFLANGRLAAVGRQEGCFVSLKTKKPVRPPAKLLSMYRQLHP